VTATPILETLAREYSAGVEHVQNALEMLDAGLCAPFIGRFRRAQVGGLSESFIRRLDRRRHELEELDRRRGTILRLLEREPGVSEQHLSAIRACMDRFELEDLFIPHRRPEPEVQLALDRGLGALADLLVAPVPKGERASLPGMDASEVEDDEGDDEDEKRAATPSSAHDAHAPSAEHDAAPTQAEIESASSHADAPAASASSESAASSGTTPGASDADGQDARDPLANAGSAAELSAPTISSAAAQEASTLPSPDAAVVASDVSQPIAAEETAALEATSDDAAHSDEHDEAPPPPTLDAPRTSHAHIDLRAAMNAHLARMCQPFVRPDKGIHTESEALYGALRILSDRLGRNPRLRGAVRRILAKHGVLSVRAAVDESRLGRHRSLLKLRQPLRQLQGHRLLAIRQAQKERLLNTVITLDPEKALPKVRSSLGRFTHPACAEVLNEVATQALTHRLLPMVEQDVRLELKERADAEALRFLAQHLRQVLFTPALGRQVVAGVDVSAKGDWTLAVLDPDGAPLGPEVKIEVGGKDASTLGVELDRALAQHDVRFLAVGHGKGPRAALNKLRAALVAPPPVANAATAASSEPALASATIATGAPAVIASATAEGGAPSIADSSSTPPGNGSSSIEAASSASLPNATSNSASSPPATSSGSSSPPATPSTSSSPLATPSVSSSPLATSGASATATLVATKTPLHASSSAHRSRGKPPPFVFLVNESGLSSYANSDVARHELEGRSVPARMAISLGRRLQDPLAEVLKIDPRHLGLGSEQGLVSKANARRVFVETIESCSAHVGCDVNRAGVSFLQHLPGIDRDTAKKIVARRAEKPFQNREELRADGLLTEAQWTSAVAFMRIHGASEPLDATSLHPEQYMLVRRMLDSIGLGIDQALGRPGVTKGLRRGDFEIDEPTWRDLTREISFPGRDPRLRLHAPALLEPGTDPVRLVKDRVVEGVISNVASFGTFVDIGLPQDAMIHISEISDRYVRDARELLSVGQVVRARILDASGPRVSLSLKNVPWVARESARDRGRENDDAQQRGPRGERNDRRGPRGRGGNDDRGRGRDRGPREARQPEPQPFVRAAQTRRDGLGGRSGGGGRGGRGGGRPGGRGGDRDGGRGRGDRRDEGGERVRLDDLEPSRKPAFSPFASFFKAKQAEKTVEGE
jgi:transcriptional accessory protein Tex/SPT6